MCWAPRSAVWSPRSSPTRTGWRHSGLLGLSGSPPIVGCGFGRSTADRLVAAARTALPSPEAPVARQVLADDLVLLACLDAQIAAAEAKMARLLPDTPFAPLTTVPGWGTVRAANYGAAVGDLTSLAGSPPALPRLRSVACAV